MPNARHRNGTPQDPRRSGSGRSGAASWLTSSYEADIHFDHLRHLAAWYGRVHARDAVQRALREEGLA